MGTNNFGITGQPLAVLAMMSDTCEDDKIHKSPWYNGRERGICFYVDDHQNNERHCVAVFEHRNSDSLCALRWVTHIDVNPPMADERTLELAYRGGDKWNTAFDVPYGHIDEMLIWVVRELKPVFERVDQYVEMRMRELEGGRDAD